MIYLASKDVPSVRETGVSNGEQRDTQTLAWVL